MLVDRIQAGRPSGSMNGRTNCLTRSLNCVPITTATASCTTFPRMRKFLKPVIGSEVPRRTKLFAPGPFHCLDRVSCDRRGSAVTGLEGGRPELRKLSSRLCSARA